MTPFGIGVGAYVSGAHGQHPMWLKPLCDAIAAGTFIYFGCAYTFFQILDGIRKKIFMRQFKFWLLGLLLMGIVSIWV